MPFLPSFLVQECLNLFRARELTYLANVANDSIPWFDLDRPIRGSGLFIGCKAIILTRSVLYSIGNSQAESLFIRTVILNFILS